MALRGQFIETVVFFTVLLVCSQNWNIDVINIQKYFSFVFSPNQGSGGTYTGLGMCREKPFIIVHLSFDFLRNPKIAINYCVSFMNTDVSQFSYLNYF